MDSLPPATVAVSGHRAAAPEIDQPNSIGTSQRQGEANHFFALAHGARLNSYSVEDVLGAGGFGITYKAREDVTEREVAIKEYLYRPHWRPATGTAPRCVRSAPVRRATSNGAWSDFGRKRSC